MTKLPKQLPTVPRPARKADPNRKRQKALAAKRQARQEALAAELHEAPEELYAGPSPAVEAPIEVSFEIPLELWREMSSHAAV